MSSVPSEECNTCLEVRKQLAGLENKVKELQKRLIEKEVKLKSEMTRLKIREAEKRMSLIDNIYNPVEPDG